jgi:hypothetical protein
MTFNLKLTSFVFIALNLSSTSCKNENDCIKVKLSALEKEWFVGYKNNDIIYFKNQNNEIDTFIVNTYDMEDFTSCNKFELGPYIYQLNSFTFDNIDKYEIDQNFKRFSIGFNKIGQDSTNLDCKKTIRFFDLSTREFLSLDKVPKEEYLIDRKKKIIELYRFTKNYNCSNNEVVLNSCKNLQFRRSMV